MSRLDESPALLVWVAAAALMGGFCRTGLAAPSSTQPSKAVPPLITSELKLAPMIIDPREKAVGAIHGANMFIAPLDIVEEKPAAIVKEPAYVGKPVYGAFKIGNGPRSVTYFSIDEAKGYAGKIFVDTNQNGDLTDDGPADWDESHTPSYGRYCIKTVTVHASWGTTLTEKESGSYTLILTKPDGKRGAAYIKTTARIGTLELGGKTYPIVLAENAGDGLFTVPADADLTRAQVDLYVDTENGQPFDAWIAQGPAATPRSPQKFNLGHPFQIDGHWYMARPSASGSTLQAQETTAPGEAKTPPAVEPETLPVGSVAPDFTIETTDGKPLHLSDYKGKLVILDFWATWCGPCQASMPLLEKLTQSVKDQNVVVLSVNVLDERDAFTAWIARHAGKDYHFDFAFDPAGKEENSLAKSTYAVPAIPAWFLITRDGKIAAKEIGFDETHAKLARALREQQVQLKADWNAAPAGPAAPR